MFMLINLKLICMRTLSTLFLQTYHASPGYRLAVYGGCVKEGNEHVLLQLETTVTVITEGSALMKVTVRRKR